MGEYDISQWRLAGTKIHTPSDPKMATGVRTGFRCIKTHLGGRPTNPGQNRHTQAHRHKTWAWCPPTRSGRCWRPHKTALVHRPRPPSIDRRHGTPDTSVTGSTLPNHRCARSPKPMPKGPTGTTPSRGPKRVQRGGSPVHLPWQGPVAGTWSPVVGRTPRAPRSRPVNPGGTTATDELTRAPRATGPDKAQSTNAGPQSTPERHAAGHNQGTRTGSKHQRPPAPALPHA